MEIEQESADTAIAIAEGVDHLETLMKLGPQSEHFHTCDI
jgi:hypothetical protein